MCVYAYTRDDVKIFHGVRDRIIIIVVVQYIRIVCTCIRTAMIIIIISSVISDNPGGLHRGGAGRTSIGRDRLKPISRRLRGVAVRKSAAAPSPYAGKIINIVCKGTRYFYLHIFILISPL